MRQRILERLADTAPPHDPVAAARTSSFAGRLGVVLDIPLTPAAVLVPLAWFGQAWHVVYIRRAISERDHHSGQDLPV